jgi:predicted metal-dependent hydrolase
MQSLENRRAQVRHRVDYWSERLKAAPRIVRIRRMTRKWGSCSTNGVITLADDLASEEREFQDYVIVHELLHLRLPNHGRLFKALMTAHVPRWRDHDQQRGGSSVHSVSR